VPPLDSATKDFAPSEGRESRHHAQGLRCLVFLAIAKMCPARSYGSRTVESFHYLIAKTPILPFFSLK
jgi:hypothetical protein